ncbi:MAG TPA: isopentenyl-diphosphate Delta-isomerase [Bacteroidia bacterium]|nr:isopentenyl-diphosphate Delta-isomerase [Bacteroidia bacterium]
MSEDVILVDLSDREIGRMEKLLAHQSALLHRAISVFVLNSAGEILLQQRAAGKYHSPGLWSNTCCSHPRPGESTLQAAHRRLMEEMGITCELSHKAEFVYKVDFGNGLSEHEYDHIFCGISDLQPIPNPAEVQAFRWISQENLDLELRHKASEFTFWFKPALEALRLKL